MPEHVTTTPDNRYVGQSSFDWIFDTEPKARRHFGIVSNLYVEGVEPKAIVDIVRMLPEGQG